jgi:uncharacterized 2Fe-2S/4Fe-4S cluster protein (DUF4445 family)
MSVADHLVKFDGASEPVRVPTGTLLAEAARQAGMEILQPCGGQGRCGRCVVQVTAGTVRRRSTLRLSAEDMADGYALACQTVVEGDTAVVVPPQEKIERRLTTNLTAAEVTIPPGYDPATVQTVRRITLTLSPPSMNDQTDDWGRLQTALRQQGGVSGVQASLATLRQIGPALREGEWQVTAILDTDAWDRPDGLVRLIALRPDYIPADAPLWGVAIDIGTTTVTLWLVDMLTGEVRTQVAEYNGQIARGEEAGGHTHRRSADAGGRIQRPDCARRGRHLAHHLRQQERGPR